MKNKITALAAFFAVAGLAKAEIVINDFLSVEGFVDMSYSHADKDHTSKFSFRNDANDDNDTEDANETGSARFDDGDSDNSSAIDQVEISWLFNFDPVTARIDLEYEDSEQDSNVEQAFVTYRLDNGSAVTAGRFASMLGFEAFEPTGLYQKSFAYDFFEGRSDSEILTDRTVAASFSAEVGADSGADNPDIDPTAAVKFLSGSIVGSGLPGYNQGVKYTYETDTSFFGISLVDGEYNEGKLSSSANGIEAAAAFDAGNGLGYFIGARIDDSADADRQIINAYVTYEVDSWLFAGELVSSEEEVKGGSELEAFQGLLLANYVYSDQASVTGRLSFGAFESDSSFEATAFKYTLAHSYAFTDNLALIAEVSQTEGEVEGSFSRSGAGNSHLYAGKYTEDYETLSFGLELLFTF